MELEQLILFLVDQLVFGLRLADRVPPQVVVALSLFLMAWGLDSHRLWRAVRRPWAALWALLVSYGAAPLLAWLLGRLGSNGDLAFGLLLMASVP